MAKSVRQVMRRKREASPAPSPPRHSLRRKLYTLALSYLTGSPAELEAIGATMENQEEAKKLLQRLVIEDVSKENDHDLVRAAEAIIRSQYVYPGEL